MALTPSVAARDSAEQPHQYNNSGRHGQAKADETQTSGTSSPTTDDLQPAQHLGGLPLVFVIIGLALAVLCLGLDRSILATAIPSITTEFDSPGDVAWYGSAYMLATCCVQLLFGRMYAVFDTKAIFCSSMVLFEVGSVVSGCAPSSVALIIGRAIQGLGAAGIMTGALIIISEAIPLHKRPIYTGIIGGISGMAQIVAPTLGGVFTDRATWRWCFWINLPLGVVTLLVVLLFVKLPSNKSPALSLLRDPVQLVWKLDLPGSLAISPAIISLLLALQWGGSMYPWSNWRIILCLVVFGLLILIWVFIEYRMGEDASLPLRLFRQRSVVGCMIYMLGLAGTMFIVVYYVPIWFQTVKGASAEQSGVNFLATTAATTVGAVLSGGLVTKIGYYVPQMYFCTVAVSIASGLIYRYQVDTSTAYWAGTLVLFGIGLGLGVQMSLTAIQTVLTGSDIAIATAMNVLIQSLSGSVFLAVSQNVFETGLAESLAKYAPQVDPALVASIGVSSINTVVEKTYGSSALRDVLVAYNAALQKCFLVCVALSCMSFLPTLFMEWRSVKPKNAKIDEKISPSENV